MMGKVVASLGASLTSSVFYILGGLAGARGNGAVRTGAIGFAAVVFRVPDCGRGDAVRLGRRARIGVQYSSGRAESGFLLVLPVMIPMLMLTPVMQQPNGALATAMSFIPPFTPMLMLMRQALPGGVPVVAAVAGLDRDGRFRGRCDLGRRPHLPHRHSFPRQGSEAGRAGAMGGARLKTWSLCAARGKGPRVLTRPAISITM